MIVKSRSCETLDMSEELESVSRQMTVVVLGSPSCGKTQIIRQFTECSYSEIYHPTKHRKTYYTSVGLNERVYQLAILDLPATRRVAKAALVQDWEALKDSDPIDAYILVFDLTSEDSFGHIRRLRDQLESIQTAHNGGVGNGSNGSGSNGGGGAGANGIPLVVMGNKYDVLFATRGHLSRRYLDIVNIIRKQWKWHYVEASAKHNWQIQLAFKTLTKLIDAQYCGNRVPGGFGSTSERLLPGVLRRSRCIVC
ncbi:putative Ras-like protein family member 10A [Hypsibius exemplaris]|uniref:Ras-like protein family member 10A n=1 Tax=Hypsibius exemplaris TaxID=2072580 RepID=A0A9X6N9F4_HYPEX|nr:putative Ras-like protein family member 10A [Hypsibius exemplaris]